MSASYNYSDLNQLNRVQQGTTFSCSTAFQTSDVSLYQDWMKNRASPVFIVFHETQFTEIAI